MVTDNELWISTHPESKSGLQIVSGHFAVSDFIVTEDEATTITKGADSWFKTSEKTGFRFGADRFGSSEVATWFNERSKPTSQNTFDDDASELNFAIQGTMTLWVSGSVFGDKQQQLIFENTFLAQGYSDLTDKWWFAIAGATNITGNKIRAKDKSGNYQLTFLRGGPESPVNRVYVDG